MRVTIDLDTLDRKKAKLYYFILKTLTNHKPIEVYQTRHGFHFIVRGCKIDFNESLLIRCLSGDDIMRLELDMSDSKRIKQVLWNEKEIKGKIYKRKRIKALQMMEADEYLGIKIK